MSNIVYAAAQPAVTSAVDLHTPSADSEERVDIIACNASSGSSAVSIGLKSGGTTRWLLYTYSLSANSEPYILRRIMLDDTTTVVVQTNTASTVDFTVTGYSKNV